jgi:hypothetical protein
MTASQNLDSLALNTMASGHLCLNLTERITWEEFPSFAERFVRAINGEITRKSDGPDLRLWEVTIVAQPLRFVFDDFPVMVSLESPNEKGDEILKRLYGELAKK